MEKGIIGLSVGVVEKKIYLSKISLRVEIHKKKTRIPLNPIFEEAMPPKPVKRSSDTDLKKKAARLKPLAQSPHIQENVATQRTFIDVEPFQIWNENANGAEWFVSEIRGEKVTVAATGLNVKPTSDMEVFTLKSFLEEMTYSGRTFSPKAEAERLLNQLKKK